MIFNNHSNLEGCHAFLGASKYNWLNYDMNTLYDRYRSEYATKIGTTLHDLARKLISRGIKLSKTDKHLVLFYLLDAGIPSMVIDVNAVFYNLMSYVNDAIGYKMTPEQILYYSDNCFGTADAIMYRNKMLRIHDYKSGRMPAHMEQLEIYAALFCLEYKVKPKDIDMELRIYQNNEILYHKPTVEDIVPIMDKIVTADKFINKLKEEG